MSRRVFISYSRHDEAEMSLLAGALRSHGYEPWVDTAELVLGRNWWKDIVSAIRDNDVVILIASREWADSEVCRAEFRYALEVKKGAVLVVLTAASTAAVLPSELHGYQACSVREVLEIKAAIDTAKSVQPAVWPDDPPFPFSWAKVETTVRARHELHVVEQGLVTGFLLDKADSSDPAERQRARHTAGTFLRRDDLGPETRGILTVRFGSGRAAVFPVVGAVLGGVVLTHLLWVSGTYVYADGVVDRTFGAVRGTGRGVVTLNFLLGMAGVVLCGLAVRRSVRAGKVGLVLCLVGILGLVLDAVLVHKWPLGW